MNSYYTLRELLSMYLFAKKVLAKMNDRLSNNMMFIRQFDVDIKDLYNKSSRLFMYIDTLEMLFENSPLYPVLECTCDNEDLTAVTEHEEVLSDDVIETYRALYSRMFTCIQLLTSSLPKGFLGGLQYDAEMCYEVEDTTTNDSCDLELQGDFNSDFNNDFLKTR